MKFKHEQSKPKQEPSPSYIHGDKDPQSFSNHMSSVIHQTGKFGGQSESKPLNNVPDTTIGKKD
jgi:hypothetical protein